MAMYSVVQGPTPRNGRFSLRTCQFPDRFGPRSNNAALFDRRSRQILPARKQESIAERRTKSLRDSPCQRRSALNRNLLSEHRTNRKLKVVPCTRNAETGTALDAGSEDRIGPEMLFNRGGIGRQIEHPPDALDDQKQKLRIRKLNRKLHRLVRVPHLYLPGLSVQLNAPGVYPSATASTEGIARASRKPSNASQSNGGR